MTASRTPTQATSPRASILAGPVFAGDRLATAVTTNPNRENGPLEESNER
jgi:hypothetical protein